MNVKDQLSPETITRRGFNLPVFLLKLLISAGLIAYFVSKIDWNVAVSAVHHTRVGYLVAGLILYPLGQVICAIKWRYLARALGIHRELKPMVGLYFIGMFFNLFLPTSIGGDITRGLYLDPNSGKMRSSFLSILVERGTGVIALLFLASLVMLSPYGATLPPLLRYGFPLLSAAGLLAIWMLPYAVRNTRTRIRDIVFQDLIIFWEQPKIGSIAVLYSAIFYSILVTIHYFIARALSLNIPLPYHVITVSLASLASLLPSFNGIGVRDAAYIYLLGQIGIDKAFGFLFSFNWFLIMAFSSFIGCVVYLIQGLTPDAPVESPDRELAHAKR